MVAREDRSESGFLGAGKRVREEATQKDMPSRTDTAVAIILCVLLALGLFGSLAAKLGAHLPSWFPFFN